MGERVAIAAIAVLLMLCASSARAHAGIDRARALYDEAEFEAALGALDEVEASTGITREELVAVLELRAELHLAMGDTDAMERAVIQRVSVDPSGALPSSAPPELRAAATRARERIAGPIEVRAEAIPVAGGVTIEGSAHGDAGGLVREVRVSARDGGSWREGAAPLTLPGAGRAEYFAEAIGPGGVVLARAGSREAPRTWSPSGAGPAAGGGGDDVWIWVGLGAGVAVAAVVITVVAVVVTQPTGPSDRTQPALPVIVSF